ncbi:MAG TPA: GNAT family N-acetyltransferase [Roseiarcus sp.]|nr:GNAT family N-acetyltransferase [Roseiarcus sp.]
MARAAYQEIGADALATPYQDRRFVEAWLRTIGAAQKIEPMIVVARDDQGSVTAILPFGLSQRAGFRTAAFVGAKHANFHMGLFRRGLIVNRRDVNDLLNRIARLHRLDALLLVNQPRTWQGESNPLAALARQESPSQGHATKLPGRFDDWFKAHYSKNAQKRLRKKARRLADRGSVSAVVARDDAMARRVLQAFFAQKGEQAEATLLANDFRVPEARRLLEIVATERPTVGRPTLELHALFCGERIIATFGGLAAAGRFCGMITSFESDPDIARSSPGELLILEVIRDLIDRGFATFDLGVGEARYKDNCCELVEPLSDLAIGFTTKGRFLAAAFRLRRLAKRWTKQTPWAWRLAKALLRRKR